MKKEKYYSLKKLYDCDCDYNLLIGQRTNGKSFAIKKKLIEDALHGKLFCYVRRWKKEIKGYMIERYFSDFVYDRDKDGNEYERIKDMTNGEYTCVMAQLGEIYLANVDEYGRKIKGIVIGYYFALVTQGDYKSLSYPQAWNLVFEEFISTEGYLPNEPKIFLHLVSTIFRRRRGRIFLVGNTIDRNFPYIKAWGLVNIMTQKVHTIEIYNVDDEENDIHVKIAVEMTDNFKSINPLAFGADVSSIVSGEWETNQYLHLDKPYTRYKKLYIMFAISQYMIFRLSVIRDDKQIFLYVENWNDEIPPKTHIVCNEYNCDIYYSRSFNDCVTIYDKTILNLLERGKVKYENDLVGTDFTSAFNIK